MFTDTFWYSALLWDKKLSLHKKWSIPLRISSVNVSKPQFSANLVIFTEEIHDRKLYFLCSVCMVIRYEMLVFTQYVNH